jgi:hypothetical protein
VRLETSCRVEPAQDWPIKAAADSDSCCPNASGKAIDSPLAFVQTNAFSRRFLELHRQQLLLWRAPELHDWRRRHDATMIIVGVGDKMRNSPILMP